MSAPVVKVHHDYFGLGIGLLSWIFPEVSVWIKVAVTILIIGLVIFLRLSKEQQTKTLKVTGNFFEEAISGFVIPAVGGGFRALFIILIVMIIADALNILHLINHDYLSLHVGSSGGGIGELILYSLGNLNSTGNTILWIAIIIGAWAKIGDAATDNRNAKRQLLLNDVTKNMKYTIAVIKSITKDPRNALWNVASFDYSFNGKTFSQKKQIGEMKIDPAKRYIVGYYPPMPDDPEITTLYGGCIVPETIREAPAMGWDTIPPEALPQKIK
jgi:hypothetical protein